MAIHILSMAATAEDGLSLTSDWIAGSINTNAVVVRRLIGDLKAAGLVAAVQANRGLRLCQQPRDITFWDVLKSVDPEHEWLAIHQDSNPDCGIGRQIEGVLSELYAGLGQQLQQQLQGKTLQDVLSQLQ